MVASRSRVSASVAGTNAGRRLSRQARRDQLVSAAIPLVARYGPAALSLDEVAERAGVTRNLLYHYFPEGRTDLVGAVVDDAERQLVGSWPYDLDQAIARILDHALAPTHAWRIHRMARALPAVTGPLKATAVALDALRDYVGVKPSALTEVALNGYVAYAEAALDHARVTGVPRGDVLNLLARVLRGVVAPQ